MIKQAREMKDHAIARGISVNFNSNQLTKEHLSNLKHHLIKQKNRKTNEQLSFLHFQTISFRLQRELGMGNSILMSELSETDDFKANY